jgi:hypothetical protein
MRHNVYVTHVYIMFGIKEFINFLYIKLMAVYKRLPTYNECIFLNENNL